MIQSSADLWIQWLKFLTDRHDYEITTDAFAIRAMAHGLASGKIDLPRAVDTLRKKIDKIEHFLWGLGFVARSRTLKESLFAASNLLDRSFDTHLSTDCDDLVSATASMPIILMMLLAAQVRSSHDNDHIFVHVSCTSNGYRIFIAPHRTEWGADWPEMSLQSDSWLTGGRERLFVSTDDWLTPIASELLNSGHSFTVRSKGPLSTFLIEFPRKEREETVVSE
jgi:hypothetical protein